MCSEGKRLCGRSKAYSAANHGAKNPSTCGRGKAKRSGINRKKTPAARIDKDDPAAIDPDVCAVPAEKRREHEEGVDRPVGNDHRRNHRPVALPFKDPDADVRPHAVRRLQML